MAKDDTMKRYREEVRRRIVGLDEVSFEHARRVIDLNEVNFKHVRRIVGLYEVNFEQIPRAENGRANALARLASSPTTTLRGILCVEHLGVPSIERERVMEVKEGDC